MGNGQSNLRPTLTPSYNTFVIQFLSAINVPKAALGHNSDPYIRACFVDSQNVTISKEVRTLVKTDNSYPVWNSYNCLGEVPLSDCYLRIEVFDSDNLVSDGLIGFSRYTHNYIYQPSCIYFRYLFKIQDQDFRLKRRISSDFDMQTCSP